MQIASQPELIDNWEQALARQGIRSRSPDARISQLIANNLDLLTKTPFLTGQPRGDCPYLGVVKTRW